MNSDYIHCGKELSSNRWCALCSLPGRFFHRKSSNIALKRESHVFAAPSFVLVAISRFHSHIVVFAYKISASTTNGKATLSDMADSHPQINDHTVMQPSLLSLPNVSFVTLPCITPKKLGLRLPQEGIIPTLNSLMKLEYCVFYPLKRSRGGRVDPSAAFINACHPWSQGSQESNAHSSEESMAYIWNWGGNDNGHNPASIAAKFKTESKVLLVENSLIDDLRLSLFADRFDSIVPEAKQSLLYQSLKAKSHELVNAIILHLDEIHMFESGRPIAHIFADLIACISFLRMRAGWKGKNKRSASEKFLASRTRFWRRKLGIFPIIYLFLTIKIQAQTNG